jgi:WD40 repeat protein
MIADLSALDFSNSVNAPGGYEEMQSWASFVASTQRELADDPSPVTGRNPATVTAAILGDRTRAPVGAGTTTAMRRVPPRRSDSLAVYLWAGTGLLVLLVAVLFLAFRGGGEAPRERPKTPETKATDPTDKDGLVRLPTRDPDADPVVKDPPRIVDPPPPPPKVDPVAEEYQRLYQAATGAFDRKDSAGLRRALDDLRRFHDRYIVASDPRHRQFAAAARSEADRLGRTAPVRYVRSLLGTGKTNNVAHTDEIVSIAFSSEPEMVIGTASRDGTARLWRHSSADDRWLSSTLRRHVGPVNSIAFSFDGRSAVTAGRDGTIRVWEVASNLNTVVLTDPGGEVLSAVFGPGGRTVVSGGADGRLRVWDTAGRDHKTANLENLGRITAVAYSSDGRSIAVAGQDRTVRIVDPTSLAQRFVLSGHTTPATSLQFSADGRTLASAGGEVKLWNASEGRLLHTLAGAHCAAFSRDGRTLAAGGSDPRLYNALTGVELGGISGEVETVKSAAFSPDGRILALAGGGTGPSYPIKITYPLGESVLPPPPPPPPPPTGGPLIEPMRVLRGPAGVNTGVVISPDGRFVLTRSGAAAKTSARLWDARTEREPVVIDLPTSFGFTTGTTNAAFSPDGRRLAVALGTSQKTGEVVLYDAAEGKVVASRSTHATGAWALKFSPDGRTLAVLGGDPDRLGELKLITADLQSVRASFQGHVGGIRGFDFSDDGRWIATLGEARNRTMEVKVWDASGKERKAPPPHESGVVSFEFTTDGRFLTVLGRDGKYRAWDLIRESAEPAGTLLEERMTGGMVAPGGKAVVGYLYSAAAGAAQSIELRAASVFPPRNIISLNSAGSFGPTWQFSGDGGLLLLTLRERADFARPTTVRFRLFETATGRERPMPTGLPTNAGPAAFSHDGALLAIAVERAVRVYETATMKQRAVAEPSRGGPAVLIYNLAFARDGRTLGVGTSDGAVRVYQVPAAAPNSP